MHTSRLNRHLLVTLALLAASPFVLNAHPLHGEPTGFLGGFTHPLFGIDHILAMVAVGIWAAQIGKRQVWLVPLSFVTLMAVGGVVGFAGGQLPLIEEGIIGSVLILGVLIAASVKMPLWSSMMLVGFLALFHGFAHGTEMPQGSSATFYAGGFVIATMLLHLVGIGLGVLVQRKINTTAVRWTGAVIIVAGCWLALL